MSWIKIEEQLPPLGLVVACQLHHDLNGTVCEHDLVRVDETDCTWRTADDHCEISYSWNVVAWKPKA